MNWNGKPYHSLDFELKSRFGQKVYKIALDGRMTCPNRDGTLGTRGCIFCSEGGSGDFAAPLDADISITTAVNNQIEEAISRIKGKMGSAPDAYIAYFQSYTNIFSRFSPGSPRMTWTMVSRFRARSRDIASVKVERG